MKSRVVLCIALVFSMAMNTPCSAGPHFRAKPLPECKTFWVTEIGLGYRLARDRTGGDGWPTFEVGQMRNLNERYAVGGAGYVCYEARYSEFRYGLEFRVRRWLKPDLSLNLSTGALLFGGGHNEEFPGFIAHLGLNYKELLIPYFGVDVLRHRPSPLNGANWQIGVKTGGAAGTGLAGVAAVVLVVTLYSAMIAG